MVIHGILVAKVAVRVLVTLHQRKVQLKEFHRECQRKVQLKAEDKQIA
jgi:heme exporter protein D